MAKSFYRTLSVAIFSIIFGFATANAQITTPPFPMPAPTLKGSGIWVSPITLPPPPKVNQPITPARQVQKRRMVRAPSGCYEEVFSSDVQLASVKYFIFTGYKTRKITCP